MKKSAAVKKPAASRNLRLVRKSTKSEAPAHNGVHGWHEVEDFPLYTTGGKKVHLSDLFGKHDELIVIQNMGKSCPYCTLWADGFSGWTDHLENRAGFALVSPDKPAELKKFAKSRGWKFKTYSSHGSDFKRHLGFQDEDGYAQPGVSTFFREKGRIYNIANDGFGPGDPYCGFWPLLDLLKKGVNGWSPKYKYKK